MNGVIFGNLSAVQAGQKSSALNVEPRLIVNSTVGKFTITNSVSKALNIAVGENIMFLNNIADVEANVAAKHPAVVAWAEEHGIDLDTADGKATAVNAFTCWFIAKGVLQYKQNGEPIMGAVRYTKEEKLAYINQNADELIADENVRAVLIERLGNENATDDELKAAITVEDIKSPEYHTSSGSKTSTSGSATGVGLQLNFTDTAIWNALKLDLGDEKDKKNRIYSVDLDHPVSTTYNNGHEVVPVMAYLLTYKGDMDPIMRGKE